MNVKAKMKRPWGLVILWFDGRQLGFLYEIRMENPSVNSRQIVEVI